MSRNGSKHVQTELSTEEYEALRELADKLGMTVKEAGHEALVSWVESQQSPDPDDPAFTVLDDLDQGSSRVTTDAREEDDVVTDWSGEDVKLELDDDPPVWD